MNFKMSKADVVINLISLSLIVYMLHSYFTGADEQIKPVVVETKNIENIVEPDIVYEDVVTQKQDAAVKPFIKINKPNNTQLQTKKVEYHNKKKDIPKLLSKKEIDRKKRKVTREKIKKHWQDITSYRISCREIDINEIYAYFNRMRTNSGMTPLTRNRALEQAADNHAEYLYTNFEDIPHDLTMHHEDMSFIYFTGKYPFERAQYEGYYSGQVGEGIAFAPSALQSIDGLMTAIYHRFGILNFYIDELGVSNYKIHDSCIFSFVHNNGIRGVNDLCKNGEESYKKSRICKDNIIIDYSLYNRLMKSNSKENPRYVLYPSSNATNIIRKFYGEKPDPIPGKQFTANPVSIQFNPAYFANKKIEVISFKIRNNNRFLKSMFMDQISDPNKIFSSTQFALFPLDIYKAFATYYVEFKYTVDGVYQRPIKWKFTTGYKIDYR